MGGGGSVPRAPVFPLRAPKIYVYHEIIFIFHKLFRISTTYSKLYDLPMGI